MLPYVWIRRSVFYSALATLSLPGCRSGSPKSTVGRLDANEQILVDAGDSGQPSYSPRGDQMVFVSGKRPAHQHTQIYLREANGTERRVTFSNGAVERPSFHPREPLIVYASSTDELKEFPPLLRTPAAATAPANHRPGSLAAPTDVYVHGLNSYDIDRLTQREGFDGQARFADDGRAVTFTVGNGDHTAVHSVQRATRANRTLQGLGQNPAEYVIAPDQTASAWLAYDADFTHARLRLRRDKQTREIAADRPNQKVDLSFSPDSRWLFWAEFNPAAQTFAPVSFEIETGCVRDIPFTEARSRRDPTLSPDGQWLTYTLIGTDKSRIARVPFAARPGPCATPP